MNKRRGLVITAALCGLLTLAACSKKEEAPAATPAAEPSAAAAPAAAPIDPATVASVSGTVKLDGAAPKAG